MFLLLFSVVGISADYHYCGEEIKSVSFWSKAEKCKTHSVKCSAHQQSGTCCGITDDIKIETDLSEVIRLLHSAPDDSNDCCSNQFEYYQLDTDRGSVSFNTVPDNHGLVYDITPVCTNTLSNIILSDIILQTTSKLIPPLLKNSYRILFQQFRL